MWQGLFTRDHSNVALCLRMLASLYSKQGKYENAKSFYQQALEIQRRIFIGDHPYVADCLNSLAQLHLYQEKYQEAEFYLQASLEITQRLFSDDQILLVSE